MGEFSRDKLKQKAEKYDKKYVKSIIRELKNYGFCFVARSDKIIDAVKEKMPDIEIDKASSNYQYFIKVVERKKEEISNII